MHFLIREICKCIPLRPDISFNAHTYIYNYIILFYIVYC